LKNTKHTFYLIIFSAFFALAITACEDKNCGGMHDSEEYFIFGHFYGKCAGEGCVELYKLEDGRLYEDDLDYYPNSASPVEAHWNELSKEKYDAVKDIEDAFPHALYGEEHVLGIPDGGDWGGIYVEVKYSGEPTPNSGFWLLDKNESYMAQVYNDFVDKIEEKITLIQ
jgi:hypothetical protein